MITKTEVIMKKRNALQNTEKTSTTIDFGNLDMKACSVLSPISGVDVDTTTVGVRCL